MGGEHTFLFVCMNELPGPASGAPFAPRHVQASLPLWLHQAELCFGPTTLSARQSPPPRGFVWCSHPDGP